MPAPLRARPRLRPRIDSLPAGSPCCGADPPCSMCTHRQCMREFPGRPARKSLPFHCPSCSKIAGGQAHPADARVRFSHTHQFYVGAAYYSDFPLFFLLLWLAEGTSPPNCNLSSRASGLSHRNSPTFLGPRPSCTRVGHQS
jgi:hypothetical protein